MREYFNGDTRGSNFSRSISICFNIVTLISSFFRDPISSKVVSFLLSYTKGNFKINFASLNLKDHIYAKANLLTERLSARAFYMGSEGNSMNP